MEGRWMLLICPRCGTQVTDHGEDGSYCGMHFPERVESLVVPVVPCDDAAIERAARALSAGMEPTAIEREQAVAVLRATGEAP